LTESLAEPISAVGGVIEQIGTSVSGVVTGIGTSIAEIVTAFSGLTESLAEPISAVGGVVEQIGTAVSTVVSTIGTNCTAIVQAFSELNTSLATPIASIGEAIQGIITSISDGVVKINDSVANILEKLAGVFNSIGQAAKDAADGFKTIAESAIALANETSVADLALSLGAVAGGVKTINHEAKWAHDNKIGDAIGEIGTGLKTLQDNSAGVDTVVTTMASISEALRIINNESKNGTAKKNIEGIGTAINTMSTNAGTEFGNLGTFAATAGTAFETLKTTAETALSGLQTAISEKLAAMGTDVSEKMTTITTAISDSVGGWATTVSEAIEAVKALFSEGFDWNVPELVIPVKTPSFSVEGTWGFDDDGNVSSVPKIKVEWYRRAAELGALFSEPTIIGVGDASQPEMLIGEDTLFNNIRAAVADAYGGLNQTINITAPKGFDAAEAARLVRNNSRQMLARMRGGV